ncbi:MAG TPA: hypothetical protein VFG11_11155 [Acidobacteriota bacterium]|nr:hypothetical protein [Acidobacteriota bacterium]
MSKVAGCIVFILGVLCAFVGIRDFLHPEFLTQRAAVCTAGEGFFLALIGLLHFRAPHKAFLISIPFLILLQFIVYVDARLFYDHPNWMTIQIVVGVVSALALWLSYSGYKRIQATSGNQST